MHGLIEKNKTGIVFIVAGFISILLSFYINVRESVINPDAICYLQSAENMKFGLYAGIRVCDQAKWPLYSLIIHYFSTLTHFSVETAAYILDGLFSLISVLTFISIVRFISPSIRILWLAALVILLAHEFNSVRQYIVRDHGFWAFYLISFFYLLRYFRDHHWRDAVVWSISLIIATLFRIEGAIFVLLVPLSALLQCKQPFFKKIKSFLQLNTLLILGVIAFMIVIKMHKTLQLARLEEVYYQLMNGMGTLIDRFAVLKLALAKNILVPDSEHESGTVLLLMLSSWYVFSVVINLSVIYSVLVVYAWLKRAMRAESYVYLACCTYILVGTLITAIFLVDHMFLSKRYLMALSLILMLWVPFALNELLKKWPLQKWPILAAIFFIVVSSLGGIFDFGYSKKYIHDAGQWLSVNVPSNATLYSNDYQLMYYSHHFDNTIFEKAREFADIKVIADSKWKQYDYLALRVNKKELDDKTNVLNEIRYPLVQVFSNKRGDQIRIYRKGAL
jgi:hypothetical protein